MFKCFLTRIHLKIFLLMAAASAVCNCRFLEFDRYKENISVSRSTSDQILRRDEVLFVGKAHCTKSQMNFEKLKVNITEGSRLVVSKKLTADGIFRHRHTLIAPHEKRIDFQISFHEGDSEIYLDFLRFTKVNDENTFEFKFNYCDN